MHSNHYQIPPDEGKTFIYRSSAGSGKTFALTKAYLKLVLLDTSRYHQVLAITFTNDAKDEMKNRIIDELTLLAEDENSDMRQAILEDFVNEKVVNIEDVVTSRGKTILNSLLHDYSRFNVSTIDHFFAQLIRHLAKELNLNLGYELDIDSKKALDESIEMLFAKADKKILGWLKEFALDQMDNDKGWDIRKNIGSLGNKLFHESYLDIEETLSENAGKLEPFIKQLKKTASNFKEKIRLLGRQGVEIAHKHHLQQADFNRGMPYAQMSKMAEEIYAIPSATFLSATTLDKWHTQKSDKIEIISQARDNGMKDVHQKLVESYTGDDYTKFLEAKVILNYIHSYGVLTSLAEKVQEYRSTNNLLFISDTAFILNKVIANAEMPFIYEKIGAKYRYLLIDEFQDTSQYQWQSLLPFFHNAVADGGQLFIVGDVKQSIYSWRGGDMKLLLHQVEKDIHVPKENARTLDTNYRSGKNIIAFNNAFFKIAPQALTTMHNIEQFLPDFEKAYKDVEQKTTKSFDGFVDIKFITSGEESTWMEQAAKRTLIEITKALNEGFSLSDMLILTRKKNEASYIANILIESGVSAISEDALVVTSSLKVQLLISTLKFIKNNDDLLAIAGFNFFYQKIFHDSPNQLTKIPALLISCKELSNRPIYEIIEELILRLKIPDNSDIYLQQLLDLSLTQNRKGNSTISSFLNWWQEEITNNNSREMAITLAGGEEAVKVMTIHKAKGLEYPIVFLPFVDNPMSPKSNNILWAKPLPEAYKSWGSLPMSYTKTLIDTSFSEAYYDEYFKTSLEALNLLYVAFTRAVERLYIFSNNKTPTLNSSNLLKLVLNNPEFKFSNLLNTKEETFTLGKAQNKASAKSKKQVLTQNQQSSSSVLSSKIAVDQKQSKLFLAFKSEKSNKVIEGIALHKAMSLITDLASSKTVLDHLEIEQEISPEIKAAISIKINLLFDKIPHLHEWFSGDYEVLNERKIMANGNILIPDRVMVKDNKAIIIDYKREQKDAKHQQQIIRYGELLQKMGYEAIEMYLIYIDDQELVEVN